MAVKAVNNTAGPDGFVSTLLIFGVYPHMYSMDPPAISIIQKTTAIEKAMDEIRKIRAENQVADAVNTKNSSLVDFVHDLFLNSDILVWQKDNAG